MSESAVKAQAQAARRRVRTADELQRREISVGSTVRLTGLVSRPDLNDCDGVVVSVDERVTVRLNDTSSHGHAVSLNVKAAIC